MAGDDDAFDFAPAANLRSPQAVIPLLARAGDRVTLLAPLTNPHEQIVAVRDGHLDWGWHGDLDEIPAGFTTELGIYHGASPREVLARWRADLLGGSGVERDAAHPLRSRLSYWTDNGAAYWYRSEPGRTIADSVVEAVNDLRDVRGVPIGVVELDSWCYPHAIARPITEIGYPEEVPPTGMLRWEPRPDAFGAAREAPTAIRELGRQVGGLPLVIHARHIAPSSPYVRDGIAAGERWWVDEHAAHPADPDFFRRWFDDAARWGVCCIELDWMLVSWFGVRELRAHAGRAADWQRALDTHAAATGVALMWCMPTPADLVTAAQLPHVIAVRTADDYRFAADPASLWTWFLTVNRLADALGLPVFKDCFFSNAAVRPGDDAIDGDPHAELEALLSALAGGPVGIGDRLGRTDRAVVMRTCDDDGSLRHPDRPVGIVDSCLFGAPARGERLAWATTATTIGDRTWTYVVAINTATERRVITDECQLDELGLEAPTAVYDWRRGVTIDAASVVRAELAPREWAYFVCCPAGEDGPIVGDRSKYVTVPSARPRPGVSG